MYRWLLFSSSKYFPVLLLAVFFTVIFFYSSLTMDTGESSMNAKGKGGEKAAGSNLRAKATNWPPAISEFLLDWYIEKKLAMPPKTFFKKMHHTACISTVNSKYGTTYTVEQVHCHWRRHKDTWGLVAKHMNESGVGWDYDTKMVTLSKSTLNNSL